MSQADVAQAADDDIRPDGATAESADQRVEQETPQPQEDRAGIEAQARRMGWRPREEFNGRPEVWRDADEYVERGLGEFPLLRDNYHKLDNRFAKTEVELQALRGQLKEATEVLTDFRAHALKSGERAYERAKREYEAQMEQAATEANVDRYRILRAERDALEPPPQAKPNGAAQQQQPTAQQQPPAQIPPEVTDFVRANSWYDNDKEMRDYAHAMHQYVSTAKPHLQLRDNLSEVRSEVMKRFPDKFDNPRRSEASAVATPAAPQKRARKAGERSFDDIADPADRQQAKEAYGKYRDQFKRQGQTYTEQEYLKVYFGDVA